MGGRDKHSRGLSGGIHPKIAPLPPEAGNSSRRKTVYGNVTRAACWAIPALLAASLGAAYDRYQSVQEKFNRIESDRLRAGSRVELTADELNAYVAHTVPTVTDGVRNPKLELIAPEVARASALVDFLKLDRSQGRAPNWLISKVIAGEHPVTVTARLRSSGGQATVDVQKVEVSGIAIDGRALQFLIDDILLPLYPNAVVGKPFELGHRIEKLDVQPGGVGVVIGR